MWDSSRISRKWGFSTDKLMLGTARKHKSRCYLMCDIIKFRYKHENARTQFIVRLGLMWSSIFHWELGVSFRYGLQVTSTCSQPLDTNNTCSYWQNQSGRQMLVKSEQRMNHFTTLAESCQMSKAHSRLLGGEIGLCCAAPSAGHPADLHTPLRARGHWRRLCRSGSRHKAVMWHSIRM